MKKFISLIAAVTAFAAISGAAMAADKTPTVYVNTTEIVFDDQEPVILGEGYTVVPARGVFEAMGATVEWKADAREVDVTSADKKTLIRLTIDNNEMKVFDISGFMSTLLSGQDFQAPETDVTLDVAPLIMNDRTMIPLRAISEALNANVQWNGEDYSIDITTEDVPLDKSGLPAYYLTSNIVNVNEGEMFDIYVNIRNMPVDTYVSSVVATLNYDKSSFEFVDSAFVNGETVIDGALGGSNPNYYDSSVKVAYVSMDNETAPRSDVSVIKLTFKSINGQSGAFRLSDTYNTRLGYDTSLNVNTTGESTTAVNYDGDDLRIDTTPIVVNAASGSQESAAVDDNDVIVVMDGGNASSVDVASGTEMEDVPTAPEDAVVLDPTPMDEPVIPGE